MGTFNPVTHPMFAITTAVPGTVVKPGVSVIVHNDLNQVVLEKRNDCGLWGMIGGRIEPGESISQTAVRETREETGFDIELEGLVGVYSEPAKRIVHYADNGDIVQLIDIVFSARIVGGELHRSEESLDVAFFSRDSLPDDLVPPAHLPLAHFFEGLRNQLG